MAIANKRWPPNVGVNNGRLRYRIKVPPDVDPMYGKLLYVEYLDLDDSATYDQAFEAAKPAKARYEALLKSLRNSSPDALTENELEALASDFLKRAKLEIGELALQNIGPAFVYQCMTRLQCLESTFAGLVTRCATNRINRWTFLAWHELRPTFPLEYMKAHRTAYGEGMLKRLVISVMKL